MATHKPWTRRNTSVHPPRVHNHLLDLIGNTPMVRLGRVTQGLSPEVEVWVKLEFMNPGGSVKDRAARQIILDAMASGQLGKGDILLDSTSGNTGVAYAMIGASLGLEVHLVMPSNASVQRRRVIEAYGAKILESDPLEGSDGAQHLAAELCAQDPRYFYADQYGNPSNPMAHQMTTAREIWMQTQGRVTHFVACMGTSGTVMGVNRGLQEFSASVGSYGAQPADAFHGLEGLKHMSSTTAPPGIYAPEELAGVVSVRTEDGWDMADRLAREEGLGAGKSAGANVFAALEIARGLERGVVVTVICDHADRYMDQV